MRLALLPLRGFWVVLTLLREEARMQVLQAAACAVQPLEKEERLDPVCVSHACISVVQKENLIFCLLKFGLWCVPKCSGWNSFP